MKKLTYYTGFLLILSGCVQKTDWSMQGQPGNRIVVDGIFTDQRSAQTLTITKPISYLNEVPQPVSGATVMISNEDSVWQMTESPIDSSKYNTSPAFMARLGKNYTLLIYYNGKIFSAKSGLVPGSLFQELQYSKNSDNNLYHIDWVASAFNSQDPAMWEVLLDWSKVPGYESVDTATCKARLLFYTFPTLDVTEIFAPKVEEIFFPAGTLITENRYSLTPGHAEFLRELMLETNWTGGLFNLANSNVITNLSDGAIGYFGICSLTSLSLTVTPK